MHPTTIDYTAEMEHDGRAYTVNVPSLDVFLCDQCSAKVLPDTSYERLADALRREAGLLMPSEIAAKRAALRLNQKDFAQLLGVAPETVSRWETGGQIQQRVMNEFMLAFFEVPALQAYLRRKRSMALPATPPEQTSEPVQGNRIVISGTADPHPKEYALNTNVGTGPRGLVTVGG